ncbi:hypothetical protein C7477_11464 [Phyllobacterium leguminum]|uniref:Lytic murein transglycosylase n=1 Tax=Phyllobacterium leguminum TaxID=314237 RepID=A0A318T0Z6_9HYPH|nr:hypothetical protein C7477_11464 [Phyllobacterium leguminum]
MEARGSTPLCPAGHLPLKGGDWLTLLTAHTLPGLRLAPNVDDGVISPLEGEMPGRAEGGGASDQRYNMKFSDRRKTHDPR